MLEKIKLVNWAMVFLALLVLAGLFKGFSTQLASVALGFILLHGFEQLLVSSKQDKRVSKLEQDLQIEVEATHNYSERLIQFEEQLKSIKEAKDRLASLESKLALISTTRR